MSQMPLYFTEGCIIYNGVQHFFFEISLLSFNPFTFYNLVNLIDSIVEELRIEELTTDVTS